jgi:hypothetical protein
MMRLNPRLASRFMVALNERIDVLLQLPRLNPGNGIDLRPRFTSIAKET